MAFNKQIYQLLWNTKLVKPNFIGINQLIFKNSKWAELKYLGQQSSCYYSTSSVATVQNCVVNASSNFARNFSNSSAMLKGNESLQSKELENEAEKKTVEPYIGEGSWKEVYRGVLTTQLRLLKMFSIGSSVIGLSMQPMLYEKLGNTNLAVVVTLCSFVGFFTFITPALIHWVSKKYVTKLEYDPKRDIYAATTLSFFLKEKKIHFKVDEVTRPEIPGMFTSFLVKNRGLFVDPNMFDDLDHYERIMGFDQPVDLSFDKDKKSNS